MTAQTDLEGFDPIGPGTPAWEASAATIIHEINGRPDEAKASRDTMVRELLANGASASLIRQWEDFIAGRVLTYKCWRTSRGRVYLPVDIAPDAPFLTDSIIANLKAIAAERIGP